jgi:hypothetical protein
VAREPFVITCPSCSSPRTLVHVDATRQARCLACGASWIQEGAWQRSINRPGNVPGSKAVATIAAPNGVSGLDVALAVLGELQRAHGAEVVEHDVREGVPQIALRFPIPARTPLQLHSMRYAAAADRVRELLEELKERCDVLLAARALTHEYLEEARSQVQRLAANREMARQLISMPAQTAIPTLTGAAS